MQLLAFPLNESAALLQDISLCQLVDHSADGIEKSSAILAKHEIPLCPLKGAMHLVLLHQRFDRLPQHFLLVFLVLDLGSGQGDAHRSIELWRHATWRRLWVSIDHTWLCTHLVEKDRRELIELAEL